MQFCNSYITLYYIAFFKPFAREQSWMFLGNDFECVNDNCFEEVSTHLLAMFCTQLVVQNIINVAVPLCTRRRRPRATTIRTDTGFNEQLIQQDVHSDPDTLPRYIEEAQSPARESLQLPQIVQLSPRLQAYLSIAFRCHAEPSTFDACG